MTESKAQKLQDWIKSEFDIEVEITDEDMAEMNKSRWPTFMNMVHELKDYLAKHGGTLEICDNPIAMKLGYKTVNDEDGELLWQQPVNKLGELPEVVKKCFLTTEGKQKFAESIINAMRPSGEAEIS